jgi:hypothetical protein
MQTEIGRRRPKSELLSPAFGQTDIYLTQLIRKSSPTVTVTTFFLHFPFGEQLACDQRVICIFDPESC